jgi:hypothetical protein
MARRKTDPYTSQAQALSTVRYGPELSALAALLRDAEDRRDTMLRQAKATRQFSVGAVDQALPQLRQDYRGAQQAVTPAFAGGGGIEAQALQARMAESLAQAQSQLQARRVGAVQGEGAARSAALRDYASDRAKIGQRAVDLSQEQGAFITSTVGDLSAADAKAAADAAKTNAQLSQSERNSLRSAGIDPDTGAPIPGGPLDRHTNGKPNGGKGWASQSAQTAAGDEIQRLMREAKSSLAGDESRANTLDFLLSGTKSSTKPVFVDVPTYDAAGNVKKDKDGNPITKRVRAVWKKGEKGPDGKPIDASMVGTPKTVDVPGFDAARSQLLATAAIEMTYDGHLSKRTQGLLHANGIQLKPLGLVTYGEWLKKNRRTRAQATNPHGIPQTPEAAPGVHGHI